MTKQIRSIVFLIFLIVFLLSAPLVILYSLGYRFNIQEAKLVQTGGLFFKVVPSSVNISVTPFDMRETKAIRELTGQTKTFNKKTGIFQGSVFIKNLFPQKYRVKIEKQGFHSWEKTLEVSEGMVTEAKDVILIPENPIFESLSQNIKDFWFLPNEQQIILEKSSGDLELFNVKDKKLSPLIQKWTPEGSLDINFSDDSKKALIKIESDEQNIFYVLVIQENPPELISLNFSGFNIKKLSFNPKNSDEIFFLKQFPEGDFVFSANYIKKQTSTEPILTDFLTYEINKEITWLNNNGYLLRRGISEKDIEYLNPEKPFVVDNNKNYQLITKDSNIILKQNNALYLFDKELKEFIKVFNNAEILEFSPYHKKLALIDNNKLWVLFLEEQKHQPYKNKMDMALLNDFSGSPGQCSWFSTQYLILADKNIKISEIDDRDKVNIVELLLSTPGATTTESDGVKKTFFNQSNKKLYILSNGNLYSSEKPLR